MAASRFVDVTDKEISEIKINSVPKNTIDLCKILKQLLYSPQARSVIGEYSLRLGEYSPIFDNLIFFLFWSDRLSFKGLAFHFWDLAFWNNVIVLL